MLAEDYNNSTLIDDLDKRVTLLGERMDWEIGPLNNREQYFCLSPNLNENLIPLVREIVEAAPELKNWKVIPFKPKKGWIGQWKMFNETGKEIMVDADSWRCVLYKFEDDVYEIDVKVEHVDGNDDIKYLAVDIVLTNLLGEEVYLKTIKNISLVKGFEEKSISIKDLDKILV